MKYSINVSAAKKEINVDWEKLPQNAKDYIISYGLKQKLNDCYAGERAAMVKENTAIETIQETCFTLAENMLANLYEGNISVRQAASVQSLEDKIYIKILRELFKAKTNKKLSIELDLSEGNMLAELAGILNKPVAELQAALLKKAGQLAELERAKAEISLDL